MFHKILIANRGEIAVRVIRACKEMGIATVAIYSQADKDALHVSLADESICVGGPSVAESYLNIPAILSAAVVTQSEAIHPGYGLLSENHKFARLCKECHIKFIGPNSEIIEKMGDKDQARRTMVAAQVPVVPGCDLVENLEQGKKEAERIGFPLLIKARAGGGGRGIRLVKKMEEFEHAFRSATTEAINMFRDGNVYMEKFLSPVKHIEMQILADEHGNMVCLGERECSVQRRNQKMIEESPSVSISPQVRNQMIEVCQKAVKETGYTNAGTIEFLFDTSGNFYFMEMNTRLQVEHPVTEMVTGIDLVQWQIKIGAGEKLGFSQKEVELKGHAIECRINAENPSQNFFPSCGQISFLHIPAGPWIRFDTAIYQGYSIPPFYDSMIGKLIVLGNTREEAIRKMKASLCELVVEGIVSNREFQIDILDDQDFQSGSYYTNFMEKRGY